MLALGHEMVCFASLGLGALMLSLRIFFVKNFCHPGGRVWVWRSRSSLRGFCFGAVVPWFLATFYRFCGWQSGPWVDLVLLAWTYHCFRLGAWSLGLASSSVTCHPSPSHGLARLGGSCVSPHFEMLSVLFPGNIGSHFLGISRSFCGNV